MRTRPHNAPGGMPYTPQEQPLARDDDNGAALQEEKTKRASTPLPVTRSGRPPHKASFVFAAFCGAATESRGMRTKGGREERTMGVKDGRRGTQLSLHSSFRELTGGWCPDAPFSPFVPPLLSLFHSLYTLHATPPPHNPLSVSVPHLFTASSSSSLTVCYSYPSSHPSLTA